MPTGTENNVTIVGNLADDPELRFTQGGLAVTTCRVAVNQRFFNKDTNAWDERLDGFFTVNVWRDMGENVAESLNRGDRVLVVGRLRSRSWETNDGQTRWVTEIEADEVCPSLRWATAKPQKVSRSGRGGPPPPDAPAGYGGQSQGGQSQGGQSQGGQSQGGQQPQGGQSEQGGHAPAPIGPTSVPEPDDVPF
jgi:single-strand DNA-binding protein